MSFTVWFRNLLRPNVVSVQTILYENNKPKDIHRYTSQKQEELMRSIQTLWDTPEGSSCWFEVELVEKQSMFQKQSPILYVNCYRQNPNNPTRKLTMNIPTRYRHKLLDRVHKIVPQSMGGVPWQEQIEVKFKLTH
jgi:hypothetical protein